MCGLEVFTLSRFTFHAKAVGTVCQMSLIRPSSVGEVRLRLRQRTEITVITNKAGDKKAQCYFLSSGKHKSDSQKGNMHLVFRPGE